MGLNHGRMPLTYRCPRKQSSTPNSAKVERIAQPSIHKSTGPRTPQGKERSKHNALKHGIFSRVAVLKGEPRSEFDSLLSGLWEDLWPEGTLQGVLVGKLAVNLWRLRRLIVTDSPPENWGADAFGFPSVDRFLILRYESNILRQIDRTLSQLGCLQRMRKGQPVPPPMKLDVSL
jgi:hypothetical protein